MKRLLRVLDKSGDTRISYDLSDTSEAEQVFKEKIAQGYSAFNVAPGTNDASKRIDSFSETSEETILVPRITAG